MADFRQLAIDFVLEDDTTKSTLIAQKAAKEIENAAPNTNPVARWVESVQPWMPGNDDDVMQDAAATPDWTGRAKALEFLSQTLLYLKPDTLKPSQVDLLVAFFGAMFDVDHKAGISASATALSQIVAMRSFHARSGKDIIEKLCKLGDDFSRQLPQTRLAVYELLRLLLRNPEVMTELRQRDGDNAAFMRELIQLYASERYPDCLMIWFDILQRFLSGYPLSKETLEEVFGAFKAYFPITLPRAAQSNVTTDELKLQLRRCFSSTQQLAPLSLPFLVGKLDQGDGVTVNVKVDVLKTIKACLEEYSDPKESISMYTDRIWTSLKYEVRNGEIEDTIWATLEVLKTLATRLADDDLRDYTLTVVRDCVNDLGTPMYTTSAGRLIVSVLSASPSTFVLMVAPTITHIKENLRHPKSPTHSLDLLKILRIILETRLLLTDVSMLEQEKYDFAAVDGIFKTLYSDIYHGLLASARGTDASEEDIKLSTEAVQGVGALIPQRQVQSREPGASSTETSPLLLPVHTCSESGSELFRIATQIWNETARKLGSDELVNETTRALQRIVNAYPEGFQPLVDRSRSLLRHAVLNVSPESMETIQSLSLLLAYLGCSSVSNDGAIALRNFLSVAQVLIGELHFVLEKQASPKIWCPLIVGLHSAIRYLNDACLNKGPIAEDTEPCKTLIEIEAKYPQIADLKDGHDTQPSLRCASSSIANSRNDALLVSLFLAGSLYKRATQVVSSGRQLTLSADFRGSEPQHEQRYLYLLSELAGFVIHELSESQQASLEVEQYFLNLFHDKDTVSSDTISSWVWLTDKPLNVLPLGVLEALRGSRVAKLFENNVAQKILSEIAVTDSAQIEPISRPARRSILSILTNKYKVEIMDPVMANFQRDLSDALHDVSGSSTTNLEKSLSLFAAISGLLRRYSGNRSQPLLQALRTAPNNRQSGHQLARGLVIIVAPQKHLTKENFAVVKPLWLQKIYVELVQPMLGTALGQDSSVTEPLIKTNYSIAVLLMLRHMQFSIYEDDADRILRIAIGVTQTLGTSTDGVAALQIIKAILVDSSDKAREQIQSLVKICTEIFTNGPQSPSSRPDWAPAGYVVGSDSLAVQSSCGKLALEIVGGLPRMFEPRHLLAYEPQVQRNLSTACGHKVRELRNTARLARGAWTDVK